MGIFVAKKYLEQLNSIETWGFISPGNSGHPLYIKKFIKPFKSKLNFFSDSIEVIKRVTLKTPLISVLPHKVAEHSPELFEITQKIVPDHTEKGHHRIIFGFDSKCSRGEAEYLVSILKNGNS